LLHQFDKKDKKKKILSKGGVKMPTSLKYKEEVLNEIEGLSDEQIINLVKIIRIFKESIVRQRESDFDLKREFEEWDRLSDEAILNFESTL